MLKRIFLFIAFCSLFYTACNKENYAPAIDLESNYYPLKVGTVYIYSVDSTAYSNFSNTSTHYQFELKDSITNVYEDLSGISNYRTERYKRIDSSSTWVIQKVFSRSKSQRDGEEFIDNQRFIRIIFPPKVGSIWNGNSKNILGEQDYMINKGVAPLTINNLSFDSTIVVNEIDESNLIRQDLVNATYARNVGLIQKDVTAVDKDISSGKITNGYVYSLKIKSFK